MLSPDGRQLAYALCDTVNGDYGGPVGIGSVDLSTGTKSILVPPTKHHDLFDLINDIFWIDDQLIAIRKIALTDGTPYLADAYDGEVINVSSGPKQIYKSPEAIDTFAKLEAFPNDDHTITVVDGKSWIVNPYTGKIIKPRELPPPKGIFSPDHTRCVRRKGCVLEVFDLKTGKVPCHLDAPESSFGSGCLEPKIVWSTDSSKLAIIIDTTKKDHRVFDRSKLLLLDLEYE